MIETGDEKGGGDTDTGEDNTYEDTDEAEAEEIIDNIQAEARLIAGKILELTGQDSDGRYFYIFDKSRNAYRKAEYRDIVILLRATKSWSDVIIDELAAKGIPAFADTGTGFFKTTEIQVMLSLLQIIDNPLQDIPLLSVLRSPVFSFTTTELAAVRIADRRASIYDALKNLAGRHPVNDGTEADKSAAGKSSFVH